MGDDKQREPGGAQSEDPGLAGAIDNVTSEEFAADDPRRDETEPAEEMPEIVRAREEGTTAPKLS
jgi:hypothetical protein